MIPLLAGFAHVPFIPRHLCCLIILSMCYLHPLHTTSLYQCCQALVSSCGMRSVLQSRELSAVCHCWGHLQNIHPSLIDHVHKRAYIGGQPLWVFLRASVSRVYKLFRWRQICGYDSFKSYPHHLWPVPLCMHPSAPCAVGCDKGSKVSWLCEATIRVGSPMY